jgi:hypothetical protein
MTPQPRSLGERETCRCNSYTRNVGNSETAILDRLILPERAELPAAAARYLLALDFDQADRERMNALAAKAQEGALSPDEAAEIDSYRHVGHLVALLQSKARRSLQRTELPASS